MARPIANIDAEIARLEAELSAIERSSAYTDGNRSLTRQAHATITARLDELYIMRDRASGAAPMFVRGAVTGLRS